MNFPTSRPRTQLRLSLEPPTLSAPQPAALMRALADLLLEALDRETATTDAREALDGFEDYV